MNEEKKELLKKSLKLKSINDLILLASYLKEKRKSTSIYENEDLAFIISEIDEHILDRTLNGDYSD